MVTSDVLDNFAGRDALCAAAFAASACDMVDACPLTPCEECQESIQSAARHGSTWGAVVATMKSQCDEEVAAVEGELAAVTPEAAAAAQVYAATIVDASNDSTNNESSNDDDSTRPFDDFTGPCSFLSQNKDSLASTTLATSTGAATTGGATRTTGTAAAPPSEWMMEPLRDATGMATLTSADRPADLLATVSAIPSASAFNEEEEEEGKGGDKRGGPTTTTTTTTMRLLGAGLKVCQNLRVCTSGELGPSKIYKSIRQCQTPPVKRNAGSSSSRRVLGGLHRARTCRYKYHAKINVKGRMDSANNKKVETTAADEVTHLDATVSFTSFGGSGGAAAAAAPASSAPVKVQLVVEPGTAKISNRVDHGNYQPQAFPGLDSVFFFAQDPDTAKVDYIEHPDDEPPHVVQIKKAIAAMLHVEDLRLPSPSSSSPTTTTPSGTTPDISDPPALLEMSSGSRLGIMKTSYRTAEVVPGSTAAAAAAAAADEDAGTALYQVSETASHITVRKTHRGATWHAPHASAGNAWGAIKMLHRITETVLIEKATGTVTKSEKEALTSTEQRDPKQEGDTEKCGDPEEDVHDNAGRCTPGTAARGEKVANDNQNSLTLIECSSSGGGGDDDHHAAEENAYGDSGGDSGLASTASFLDEGDDESDDDDEEEKRKDVNVVVVNDDDDNDDEAKEGKVSPPTPLLKRSAFSDISHMPDADATARMRWEREDRTVLETTAKHLADLRARLDARLAKPRRDRDHAKFSQIIDLVKHRPPLLDALAAAASNRATPLEEFEMVLNILSSVANTRAQRGILGIIQQAMPPRPAPAPAAAAMRTEAAAADREAMLREREIARRRRGAALSALTVIPRPPIPEVVAAVERLALGEFAPHAHARSRVGTGTAAVRAVLSKMLSAKNSKHQQHQQPSTAAARTDPIAWAAPTVLGAFAKHLRTMPGVSSTQRADGARLQKLIEDHTLSSLRNGHLSEHQRIWLASLGNTHHGTGILPVVAAFLETTEHDGVRARAIHALRSVEHPDAASHHYAALKHAAPLVRGVAVRNLLLHQKRGGGRRDDDDRDIDELSKALADEQDPHVLGLVQLATGADLDALRQRAQLRASGPGACSGPNCKNGRSLDDPDPGKWGSMRMDKGKVGSDQVYLMSRAFIVKRAIVEFKNEFWAQNSVASAETGVYLKVMDVKLTLFAMGADVFYECKGGETKLAVAPFMTLMNLDITDFAIGQLQTLLTEGPKGFVSSIKERFDDAASAVKSAKKKMTKGFKKLKARVGAQFKGKEAVKKYKAEVAEKRRKMKKEAKEKKEKAIKYMAEVEKKEARANKGLEKVLKQGILLAKNDPTKKKMLEGALKNHQDRVAQEKGKKLLKEKLNWMQAYIDPGKAMAAHKEKIEKEAKAAGVKASDIKELKDMDAKLKDKDDENGDDGGDGDDDDDSVYGKFEMNGFGGDGEFGCCKNKAKKFVCPYDQFFGDSEKARMKVVELLLLDPALESRTTKGRVTGLCDLKAPKNGVLPNYLTKDRKAGECPGSSLPATSSCKPRCNTGYLVQGEYKCDYDSRSAAPAVNYTVYGAKKPATAAEARYKCPVGRRLATVRNDAEQKLLEAVSATAQKTGVTGESWPALWLGGKYSTKDKAFTWDSDDDGVVNFGRDPPKITYNTKWAGGNGPNNGNLGREPWLCFKRADNTWHDCGGGSSEKLAYVCEKREPRAVKLAESATCAKAPCEKWCEDGTTKFKGVTRTKCKSATPAKDAPCKKKCTEGHKKCAGCFGCFEPNPGTTKPATTKTKKTTKKTTKKASLLFVQEEEKEEDVDDVNDVDDMETLLAYDNEEEEHDQLSEHELHVAAVLASMASINARKGSTRGPALADFLELAGQLQPKSKVMRIAKRGKDETTDKKGGGAKTSVLKKAKKEVDKALNSVSEMTSSGAVIGKIDQAFGGHMGKAINKLNGKTDDYMALQSFTPACGIVAMDKWLEIEKFIKLASSRVPIPFTPIFIVITVDLVVQLGIEGAVDDCMSKNAPTSPSSQAKGDYDFVVAGGPYFTIGVKVSGELEIPFVVAIKLEMRIDLGKTKLVMSLTTGAPKWMRQREDSVDAINAGDLEIHLLRGEINLKLIMFPIPSEFDGPAKKALDTAEKTGKVLQTGADASSVANNACDGYANKNTTKGKKACEDIKEASTTAKAAAGAATAIIGAFSFEIELIKLVFPGFYPAWACVIPLGVGDCPEEYFLNAPGPKCEGADRTDGKCRDPLTDGPLKLWCEAELAGVSKIMGDKASKYCPHQHGFLPSEDMSTYVVDEFKRGECKKNFHCMLKDFDGQVLSKFDASPGGGAYQREFAIRMKNDYRFESVYQNQKYNHAWGLEMVAGVERPVDSYVTWRAQVGEDEDDNEGLAGVVTIVVAKDAATGDQGCNSQGLRLEVRVNALDLTTGKYVATVDVIEPGKTTRAATYGTRKGEEVEASTQQPMGYWVAFDSLGHLRVGNGETIGDNQWFSLALPRDLSSEDDGIFWTTCAGLGAGPAGTPAIAYQDIEVNRGKKTDVYCDWINTYTKCTPGANNPNTPKDCAKEKIVSKCFRKMPDALPEKYGKSGKKKNALGFKKTVCNKVVRDTIKGHGKAVADLVTVDSTQCLSGSCREFGVGDLRCAGCVTDFDCETRQYVGGACAPNPDNPDLAPAVYLDTKSGQFRSGRIIDFDATVAPAGVYVLKPYNKATHGAEVKVPPKDVHVCTLNGSGKTCPVMKAVAAGEVVHFNWQQVRANGYTQTCQTRGTMCPPLGSKPSKDEWKRLQAEWAKKGNVDPRCYAADAPPIGNRNTCAKDDTWGDGSTKGLGPRKFFCQPSQAPPPQVGAWCTKHEHCDQKTQFCHLLDADGPRCKTKIPAISSVYGTQKYLDDVPKDQLEKLYPGKTPEWKDVGSTDLIELAKGVFGASDKVHVCGTDSQHCWTGKCDIVCVQCWNRDNTLSKGKAHEGCKPDEFCAYGRCYKKYYSRGDPDLPAPDIPVDATTKVVAPRFGKQYNQVKRAWEVSPMTKVHICGNNRECRSGKCDGVGIKGLFTAGTCVDCWNKDHAGCPVVDKATGDFRDFCHFGACRPRLVSKGSQYWQGTGVGGLTPKVSKGPSKNGICNALRVLPKKECPSNKKNGACNRECLSWICDLGTCTECRNSNSEGCPASKYCSFGECEPTLPLKDACKNDRQCTDRACQGVVKDSPGLCVECSDNDDCKKKDPSLLKGGPRTKVCDRIVGQFVCKDGIKDLRVCEQAKPHMCLSGKCVAVRVGKAVCQPAKKFSLGNECYAGTGHHECDSGFCAGLGNAAKCAVAKKVGKTCGSSLECKSGWCASGICRDQIKDYDPCTDWGHDACKSGTCTYVRSDLQRCKPKKGFRDKSKCYAVSGHGDCESGFCKGMGNAAKCAKGKVLSEKCGSDLECRAQPVCTGKRNATLDGDKAKCQKAGGKSHTAGTWDAGGVCEFANKAACEKQHEKGKWKQFEETKCVGVRGGYGRCMRRGGFHKDEECADGEHHRCAGDLYCNPKKRLLVSKKEDAFTCDVPKNDLDACEVQTNGPINSACLSGSCREIKHMIGRCKPVEGKKGRDGKLNEAGAGFPKGHDCYALDRSSDCAAGLYCQGHELGFKHKNYLKCVEQNPDYGSCPEHGKVGDVACASGKCRAMPLVGKKSGPSKCAPKLGFKETSVCYNDRDDCGKVNKRCDKDADCDSKKGSKCGANKRCTGWTEWFAGGTASQSSEEKGGAAANARDKKPSTRTLTKNENNPWWRLDLAKDTLVQEVVVAGVSAASGSVRVAVGNGACSAMANTDCGACVPRADIPKGSCVTTCPEFTGGQYVFVVQKKQNSQLSITDVKLKIDATSDREALWCDKERCKPKYADYKKCVIHDNNRACLSGSCKEVESLKPLCRPKKGWADGKQCYVKRSSECESQHCAEVRAGLGYCKPKSGFDNGKQCWTNKHSQCASGWCSGFGDAKCTAALKDYSDCPAHGSDGPVNEACKNKKCQEIRTSVRRCIPGAGLRLNHECLAGAAFGQSSTTGKNDQCASAGAYQNTRWTSLSEGTASQSHTSSTNVAGRARNGDLAQFALTGSVVQPWWRLDLGEKRNWKVHRVKVRPAAGHVASLVGAEIRVGDSPSVASSSKCGPEYLERSACPADHPYAATWPTGDRLSKKRGAKWYCYRDGPNKGGTCCPGSGVGGSTPGGITEPPPNHGKWASNNYVCKKPMRSSGCPAAFPYAGTWPTGDRLKKKQGANWYCYKDGINKGATCVNGPGSIPPPFGGKWGTGHALCPIKNFERSCGGQKKRYVFVRHALKDANALALAHVDVEIEETKHEPGACARVRYGEGSCKPRSGFKNGEKCYDGNHGQCESGFCHFTEHKCRPKRADYDNCIRHDGHQACTSGSCKEVETGKPLCRPKGGWADNKQCYSGRSGECASKKCEPVRLRSGLGDLAYCKPSNGFANGRQCYATRHHQCESGLCKGVGDAATCTPKKEDFEVCSLPKTGDIECKSGTCTTVRVGQRSRCRPTSKFPNGRTYKSECVPVAGNGDCASGACALDGYCTPPCKSHSDCSSSCKDGFGDCRKWSWTGYGGCKGWFKSNCKESCGVCTGQYCDVNVCKAKLNDGTVTTLGASGCKSGIYDAGACRQCTTSKGCATNEYCGRWTCKPKKKDFEVCSLPKTGDIECKSGTCTTVRVGQRSRCRPTSKFPNGRTYKSECVPVAGNGDCASGACALDGYCVPKCTSHNDCGTSSGFATTSKGATACSGRSRPITSASQCQEFARSVGKSYHSQGAWNNEPKGCDFDNNNKVYFNTVAKGSSNSHYGLACVHDQYCDVGVCMAKLNDGTVTTLGARACKSGIYDAAACRQCVNSNLKHCKSGYGCNKWQCKKRLWWNRVTHYSYYDCNCRYNKHDFIRAVKKCDRCRKSRLGGCPVVWNKGAIRIMTESGTKCWDWDW